MNIVKNLLWMLAGGALFFAGQLLQKAMPVHAQTQLGSEAACVTRVPKTWGNYVGASTYGLTFQDDKGTLRFIKSPSCGEDFYTHPSVYPTVDLMIGR